MADLGADVTAMLDNVEQTVRALAARFGFTDVGGVRPKDRFPDHPGGYAADYMTKSKAQGDALVAFQTANARELGVDYQIWYGRVWDVDRDPIGLPHDQWRRYTSTSNPHTDHVHTTYKKGVQPQLQKLGTAAGNLVQTGVGSLFDLDEFMQRAHGTSVTLLAAGLGVVLLGVGLVVAVRPAIRKTAKQITGV